MKKKPEIFPTFQEFVASNQKMYGGGKKTPDATFTRGSAVLVTNSNEFHVKHKSTNWASVFKTFAFTHPASF